MRSLLGTMEFEVRGDSGLLASCSDASSALMLAREWLCDAAERTAGVHTCVVQIRDGQGRLVGEHVVALSDGPLAR